jgi:3-hexulose-6-phosphate synthase
MKLQVAFDLLDLDKALEIASEVAEYADILEVGSLLIFKHGDHAVRSFKERFPQKTILADTKIVDRGKEVTQLFSNAGADWITVMAGTSRNIIHNVAQSAHELGKRVMLDLLDASSLGQSALEAKSLGADAVLFHRPSSADQQVTLSERWDMVKGNTQLPIFIAAPVSRETIHEIISLNPHGLIISSAITQADNPRQAAEFFHSLLEDNS